MSAQPPNSPRIADAPAAIPNVSATFPSPLGDGERRAGPDRVERRTTRTPERPSAASVDCAADRRRCRLCAPRDGMETMLAEVWEQVLRVGRLGVHDNFFHLGGNSLLAAMATARASDRLGVEHPREHALRRPTIADLAGGSLASDALMSRPLILPDAARRRLFPRRSPSSGSGSSTGSKDGSPPTTAYGRQAARHAAIERFAWPWRRSSRGTSRCAPPSRWWRDAASGPPPSPFELDVEDLRGLAPAPRESAVAEQMREEADRPFDLGRGPVLRASLLAPGR